MNKSKPKPGFKDQVGIATIKNWIAFLILASLISCEKETVEQVVRPVKAIKIENSSAKSGQIIFPGTLRAFKRADLSFRVDGTVIKRDISVGRKMMKGDLLIQLDPREYEISLKKSEAKVESVQAQLDFASRDFERMKNIFNKDPGAISESLLDRKRENVNQLKADLLAAKSDSDKAADDLSYTSLKAPFDGIIAAIYVENHGQVRAKQTVVRMIDTDEREMEINVPEKIISSLIESGSALLFTIYLDAFPDQSFTGSIKEIGTEASSTTQTYPVTLTLKQVPEELYLLAGMSGRAVLKNSQGGTSPNVYTVPKTAIFMDHAGKNNVWVIDPATGTVHKKNVELEGSGRGDAALIKEGVSPGEWVVIAGTSFLSEGQKVKFSPEQSKL